MRHRFFADVPLAAGERIVLDRDEQHHARVVRVRDGEEVEVFNGRGDAFFATWSADALQLTKAAPDREARGELHLAMAIINLDKFDLVLQKATELGVRSIIPLETDRVEIRAERYRGKAERWQRIVFEAVKQCGRSRIPSIEAPQTFDDVVARAGLKILFDADAPEHPETAPPRTPATLLIGPEGGWSERELATAREAGCTFERLGIRRLRAETAAIAAVTLLAARNGDLR